LDPLCGTRHREMIPIRRVDSRGFVLHRGSFGLA
jgi:hypothetical protein